MENTNNKPSGKGIYIIIIIIQLAVIVWLVYDKLQQQEKTDVYIAQIEKVQFQRDSIKTELTTLWEDYESLKTDNDTLNARLLVEQQKIERMIKDVHVANSKTITQYKKELASLRQIMRGYIVQIDSLNNLNLALTEENRQIRSDYREARSINEVLAEKNDSLVGQVEKASELKALNIQILGLNRRDKVTNNVEKIEKLQVCCDLSDNSIAPKGLKDVYVRISRPDGLVLSVSESNVFAFNGTTLTYSAKRQVSYKGEKEQVCVFWKTEQTLPAGEYFVDIFVDGRKIGTASVKMK